MKNKRLWLYILTFVVIVAFGIVLNSLVLSEKERISEEKDNIVNLVKDLGVKGDLVENNPRTLLKDGDTKILQKFEGYNSDEKLVALVYVGITKGYKDDLKVAFAIDIKTHEIVGFKLLENNETEMYVNALLIEDFTSQFKEKSLEDKFLNVETISGATPGGGTGIIAPATSAGFNKILQLVRKQYDKDGDSNFVMPAMLEIVSKEQDYSTLNIKYSFKDGDVNVELVVNTSYEFVSISDVSYQVDALAIAKSNKLDALVSEVNGNTITILSAGFGGTTLTSTAEVDAENNIVSFITDLSNQTYYDANDSDFDVVFEAIENKAEIPAVSGATITRNGIEQAKTVLYAYLGVN